MVNLELKKIADWKNVYDFPIREVEITDVKKNIEVGIYKETCKCHPERETLFAIVPDGNGERKMKIRLEK